MANRDPFALGFRQVFGFVTLDSAASLHSRVSSLLFEDHDWARPRLYTWVCAYEYAEYRPEVRTGQKAEKDHLILDDDRAAIQVVDSYGVWSLDGSLREQPAYSDGDVLRQSMYVVISDRHLQARLRTPEGRLAWWHLQLEGS